MASLLFDGVKNFRLVTQVMQDMNAEITEARSLGMLPEWLNSEDPGSLRVEFDRRFELTLAMEAEARRMRPGFWENLKYQVSTFKITEF